MYNRGKNQLKGAHDMRINEKVLSLPPYISTSWANISHLQMNQHSELEVILHNGSLVKVPGLSKEELEQVFLCHAKSIEDTAPVGDDHFGLNPGMVLSGMENFTGMMQHDPNQSGASDLPSEVLAKIADMGKFLGINTDTFNIPEGEPDCNCPYCQISRAVHGHVKGPDLQENIENTEVSNEELTFREWNVDQKNEKLYEVTNPFDANEKYSVYLGDPIGCTCGKNNCDHILAVLKS